MKSISLFLLVFSFTFSGCSPPAMVSGIILSEHGAVKNPLVLAYRDFQSLATQQDAIVSRPGEKPGQFQIHLKPGSYYLTATGIDSQQQLFSYHGLNPITITEEDQWVPFLATPDSKATCQPGFQGIGGHVYYKGEPAIDGGISVYALDDQPFRGMGLLTNTITSDGAYWFGLEPGRYVLVARKRLDQTGIGPLKHGDLFCYTMANPIEVRSGKECMVDLNCYPRDDIDGFLVADASDPRGKREIDRRSLSPKDITAQTPESSPEVIPKIAAVINGKVTDLNGTPQEGLFVTAFPSDDLNLFQMYIVRFKTPFMAITDKNGEYHLAVKSGSYYLVARQQIGVAPEHLEYYGLYEGTANHDIMVRPSETRNDGDIVVGKIMP